MIEEQEITMVSERGLTLMLIPSIFLNISNSIQIIEFVLLLLLLLDCLCSLVTVGSFKVKIKESQKVDGLIEIKRKK